MKNLSPPTWITEFLVKQVAQCIRCLWRSRCPFTVTTTIRRRAWRPSLAHGPHAQKQLKLLLSVLPEKSENNISKSCASFENQQRSVLLSVASCLRKFWFNTPRKSVGNKHMQKNNHLAQSRLISILFLLENHFKKSHFAIVLAKNQFEFFGGKIQIFLKDFKYHFWRKNSNETKFKDWK